MKNTRNIVVAIAAVAALGIAAATHAVEGPGPGFGPGNGPCTGNGPGNGPGMGPMGGMRGPQGMHGFRSGADPSAMIEGRLAYLKSALKITAAQDAAWQAYSAKLRQQGAAMQARRAAVQNVSVSSSAPERMAQRTTLMQQQLGNMEAMTGALKDLYAALTPEQKALADQNLGNMHQGYGRHFR